MVGCLCYGLFFYVDGYMLFMFKFWNMFNCEVCIFKFMLYKISCCIGCIGFIWFGVYVNGLYEFCILKFWIFGR